MGTAGADPARAHIQKHQDEENQIDEKVEGPENRINLVAGSAEGVQIEHVGKGSGSRADEGGRICKLLKAAVEWRCGQVSGQYPEDFHYTCQHDGKKQDLKAVASFRLVKFDYGENHNDKGEEQGDDIKVDFRVFENKVHAC